MKNRANNLRRAVKLYRPKATAARRLERRREVATSQSKYTRVVLCPQLVKTTLDVTCDLQR